MPEAIPVTRSETSTETIPELLAAAARRDPHGIWLRTDEGMLSFGDTAAQVGRLATRLDASGVRHGDLVVLTIRTTPTYLLCWLALTSLGAVTVPTDPAGTAEELAGLLAQTRPPFLVTDEEKASSVDAALSLADQSPVRIDIDDLVGDWRVVAADSADDDPPRVAVVPDDLAVLIPTSGTTGR